MSRAPYAVPSARFGAKMGDQKLVDMMTGALACPMGTGHMGVTAENVSAEHDISREAQDEFALESQKRAAAAIAAGGSCEGAPGLRPQYHADYYGAYFRDPDGNKLAVCCHRPEALA